MRHQGYRDDNQGRVGRSHARLRRGRPQSPARVAV